MADKSGKIATAVFLCLGLVLSWFLTYTTFLREKKARDKICPLFKVKTEFPKNLKMSSIIF